ncbi:MAG TPA: hypothetical protein VFB34_12590, partial [Chloroflexota bacterium]|nr:hypothetical protein [Chloroflexota bacterium]
RSRTCAACNLGGLERWGWISVGDQRGGRREGYGSHRGIKGETVLRPTRAGSHARRLWPAVIDEVERRWRDRFGHGTVEAVRDALERLANHGPWSLPEIHASNGFFTNTTGEGVTDEPRSTAALIGQALTALTLDHEQRSKPALPLGANVLRVIGDGGCSLGDLPHRSGISKEAAAMAVNYLIKEGMVERWPERTIVLTHRGLQARNEYEIRAAAVNHPRLRAALEELLSRREALVEGLAPPEGCWRSERPYAAQTRRLLVDPTSALPWQPMVLHRGGWPDGA